ncbi:MAG: protein of unknown function with transrane region [Parcubacteria group bacterium]|nr:protein of unknown function with transrane region [Parcubacteria group bacterium]
MADSSSPNPYIRTYAKDMAALSKKTEEGAGVPPGSPPLPAAHPEERKSVLARLSKRTNKEPAHESTLLPNTLPTPQPKAASIGSPTLARPEPLPPSAIPPRPKVVVVAPPPAPPKPIAPPPRPVAIAPHPVPVSSPPPLPPVLGIKEPPSPLPQLVPKAQGPSPLHTYSSDFSDCIDTKNASAFSVLAAQSDAQPVTPKPVRTSSKSRRGLLITIAGIVLILVGGIGVFAAYHYVSTHSVVAVAPSVPSLIFADERQALVGEGPQLVQAIADSSTNPLPDGQVRVLYLTVSSTTASGKSVITPLAGGRLVGALQLSAPDILLRNIAPESTVGIVHAGSETRAFFILKVLSYERTFAGMLQWEGRMQSDLATLYPEYPLPVATPTVVTTTKIVNGRKVVATTTVAAAPVFSAAPHFVDEVASNHDVRALKDGHGQTILLYGYKDKETLIIARNEAAFAELLNRLAATKQQ